MKRVIVPLGLAAGLLIALGLLIVGVPSRVANAAEMLKAAAAANKAFDGWVHATTDNPASLSKPREGITIQAAVFYLHPVRKIVVRDVTINGVRTVIWMDHQANMQKLYDSASNAITAGPIPEAEKQDGASEEEILAELLSDTKRTPWQIGQILFGMPTLDGVMALVDNNWCTVAMTHEQDNDRYTFTFNKDKLTDPKDAARSSLVLLVDPRTSLMRKWIGTFPDGRISLTFTYNDPVLNDIQDVGLPPDVKTSSLQAAGTKPAADAEAVLDRLDRLAAMDEQLGTYTAVATESFDYDGKRPDRHYLQLWGRQGRNLFVADYRKTSQGTIAGVPGWPLPKVADVIAAARTVQPDSVLASDGATARFGRKDRGQSYRWWAVDLKDLNEPQWVGYTLTGEIWPGRHIMDYKHGNRIKIEVQLLTSPDRPGQVGVQVDESGLAIVIMRNSRLQMIWWLDPARNDVPVEKIKRFYGLKGELENEEVTKYAEYAQLPNGLWYPTAWETTDSNFSGGDVHVRAKVKGCLQFVPGMALDAEWFSDPQERYEAAVQSAASQPNHTQ
jgi:hypothetical protein